MKILFSGFVLNLLINNVLGIYYKSINCNEFNNKTKCLDNWPCMWCEYENISNCKSVSPCSEFQENCEYNNKPYLITECTIISVIFYSLVVLGYTFSIFWMAHELEKILLRESISDIARQRLIGFGVSLVTIQFIFVFFFKPSIFYMLFASYMAVSLLFCSCININRYKERGGYMTLKT